MAPTFEIHNQGKRIKRTYIALTLEILFTVVIACVVVFATLTSITHQGATFADGIKSDYTILVDKYVQTFDTVYLQIIDKIERDDPSFDELNVWLQQNDSLWSQSMGEEVYDGIALTYKGGYARSWKNGNYATYDATKRPWWQTADRANGATAIVPPYVSYLDSQMADNESYVLMSVVKKYNDSISFDYDVKLSEVRDLMENRNTTYEGTRLVMFDPEGYVLSSSDSKQYAHNLNRPDAVISDDLGKTLTESRNSLEAMTLQSVDGTLMFLYTTQDESGNYITVMVPFVSVFLRNILLVILVAALLIAVEVWLARRNYQSLMEYRRRDQRLNALADATFDQRLFVDLSTLSFFGNKVAAAMVPSASYGKLFSLFLNRIPQPEERSKFNRLASPTSLRNREENMKKIARDRFGIMWPTDESDELTLRTIEVGVLVSVIDNRETASIVCRDISESAEILKEALGQAQQASEAKGAFLSKMSHEIRTPLNAVIGYLGIARDETDNPEKVERCLEQASIASKNLLGIINDVLDNSSIESGRMKIANEDFDVTQLVQQLTTVFYGQAKAKGINFEVSAKDITDEWVCGDSLRVNQVLMNLLSNAMKFTPKDGTIRMTIEQKPASDDKVHMRFCVSDSGIGMSKDFLGRLFTPFEQESASTARKYGGTGLGLSISNNLVKLMGGTMDVESEEGSGTTFSFNLAFGRAASRTNEHLATESFSHLRALVVDDDESSCDYTKKLLERCGIACDTLTDGKKAVRRVRGRLNTDYPYDFCVVDWNMPGQNGLETSRQIRELCGPKVPVIMATAYDYSDIVDEAHDAGVDKMMSKPLFQSTLFDALVSTFGKYEPSVRQQAKDSHDFAGLNVLLAEDNEMNMDIAREILNKAKMNVTGVGNGKLALETFEQSEPETFDIILMDVQMPVMDGYEAARAIRQCSHPQAQSIPIIAMTANAFTSDVTEALAAGMNDHIAKPINYELLFEALWRLTKHDGFDNL